MSCLKKKLATCKIGFLSVGGRLTRIKSIIGSLGTYYMSLFKLPESVARFLESLRSRFFVVLKMERRILLGSNMTCHSWKNKNGVWVLLVCMILMGDSDSLIGSLIKVEVSLLLLGTLRRCMIEFLFLIVWHEKS